jgi:hypothetical protein
MPKKETQEIQPEWRFEDLTLQPNIDFVRSQIEKAQQFIAAAQEHEAKLVSILSGRIAAAEPRTPTGYLYAGWRVIDAIGSLLAERDHALSKQELTDTVLARGVFKGKGKNAKGTPDVQVGKSITYFLMNGQNRQDKYKKRKIKAADPILREMNELIGLAEWPDEKFVLINS